MNKMTSFALCAALLGNVYNSTKTHALINDPEFKKKLAEGGLKLIGIAAAAAIAAYIQIKGTYFFTSKKWQIHRKGTIKESFRSVAGNDTAKADLNDIVQFLKNPSAYKKIGALVPKGVLLEGPPGTGKTLLARALAGEANCAFIPVSGSEFVELWVGTGAARVRSLFDTARSQGPCIIFIDEIDALIKKRANDTGMGGVQEANQTLNEFLKQVDGFEKHKFPIIIIGATNRADAADPAALRPGRFDRIVYVGLPNVTDREKILALHLQKTHHSANINLHPIASRTAGFSGADLANLINEAAIIAINKNKTTIDQSDLEMALDKIIMGKPNKNTMITIQEKKITAYHEAGHALTHKLLNQADISTLHKVSIIPHGNAGGYTAYIPKERMFYSKQDFLNQIMIILGGKAAEELIYNTSMTGPSHDLHTVTNIARSMVCTYGMSEKIGIVSYHYAPEIALAPYAESTLAAIDEEVKNIINTCYKKTLQLLTEHKSKLIAIAEALVEKEELSAEEVYFLIQ